VSTLEQISAKGYAAVRELRLQKFRAELPFMIYTRDLPSHQFYLEYANGLIQLAQISSDGQSYDIHRHLSISESDLIRQKYNLV
jgi:hypothetical protein